MAMHATKRPTYGRASVSGTASAIPAQNDRIAKIHAMRIETSLRSWCTVDQIALVFEFSRHGFQCLPVAYPGIACVHRLT